LGNFTIDEIKDVLISIKIIILRECFIAGHHPTKASKITAWVISRGEFMTLTGILVLYLAFRAKQLICDFFLQSSWMALVKGQPMQKDGSKALIFHAGIHAAFTLVLMLIFAPTLWWLGIVDFIVHAAIDKTKVLINNKTGWTYKDNAYWWAYGIDQEAHNLTHLAYIIFIVVHSGTSLH
jgi:hypothetical protein